MVTHRGTSRQIWISGLSVWMIGALGVQFLLGMYINLFVSLPVYTTAPVGPMAGSAIMMGMVGASPLIMFHALWALGLAVGGLVVVLETLLSHRADLVWVAGIGFMAILVAGWAGLEFLMAGQHNAMSYVMALGWLGAMLAYLVIARDSSAL